MARLDQSAAAMAAEVAQLRTEEDAIEAMPRGSGRRPKEELDRANNIGTRLYELMDEIVDAPVASFADALSVLLAASARLLADIENGTYDLSNGVPLALAFRRATDFLAAYMGTNLAGLGAVYFRCGDKLWSEGKNIRADWWVEKALASGFAFKAASDGALVICAPIGEDVDELCAELPALDRDCLNKHVRFLIRAQRNPERPDRVDLARNDWWLTSRSLPKRTRTDLEIVCGDLPA